MFVSRVSPTYYNFKCVVFCVIFSDIFNLQCFLLMQFQWPNSINACHLKLRIIILCLFGFFVYVLVLFVNAYLCMHYNTSTLGFPICLGQILFEPFHHSLRAIEINPLGIYIHVGKFNLKLIINSLTGSYFVLLKYKYFSYC